MQTAENIINIIEERVRNNESISPVTYLESATRVVILSGDLDNKLANYEAEMNSIEAEYIKTDMPASKAKVLAKSEIDYKDYLKTKALLSRINNWIMLAKRRAVIQDL